MLSAYFIVAATSRPPTPRLSATSHTRPSKPTSRPCRRTRSPSCKSTAAAASGVAKTPSWMLRSHKPAAAAAAEVGGVLSTSSNAQAEHAALALRAAARAATRLGDERRASSEQQQRQPQHRRELSAEEEAREERCEERPRLVGDLERRRVEVCERDEHEVALDGVGDRRHSALESVGAVTQHLGSQQLEHGRDAAGCSRDHHDAGEQLEHLTQQDSDRGEVWRCAAAGEPGLAIANQQHVRGGL
eukprot:scaffold35212_cov69-Phaeocystis_antarctica.AAC.7